MKHLFLVAFTAGLLVLGAQADDPKTDPPKATPVERPPAIRFAPNAVPISGASPDVLAVAVTADGKRIATGGGTTNPMTGFLSVLDAETKKDLLALDLARPVNAVGFSP